jgi:hypothetical protein
MATPDALGIDVRARIVSSHRGGKFVRCARHRPHDGASGVWMVISPRTDRRLIAWRLTPGKRSVFS